MIFGRTELIIGESGAENRQDSVGKVRLLVAPQIFEKNPNFFISISVGKLQIHDTIYLGVAPAAPIGRCLLGKVKNDQF